MKIGDKRKIAVVNVANNKVAPEIIREMKKSGFENIIELQGRSDYAGYYAVAEEAPDYTIFVEERPESCKVRPCRVQGYAASKSGRFVARDLQESQKAKEYYRHYLKMLGQTPKLMGAKELPFSELQYKETEWFYLDKSPLLWLTLPPVEGIGAAVTMAIRKYFTAQVTGR